MEAKELQEKGKDKALLNKFILSIDKFFDIMPYEQVESRNEDLVNLKIDEINKDFSINSKSFIETIVNSNRNTPVEIRKTLEYLKIYFVQLDNGSFSICFSISSKQNCDFGEHDSFLKIDENKNLIEIKKTEFKKHHLKYKNNLLPTINSKTKIDDKEINNTEVISYKLKDLYLFLIYHFLLQSDYEYSKLYFKMIKFEKNVKVSNNQNKLSLVVRAEKSSKDKGEYYDFGTIYP
ncbi:hypothetical protein [Flavobacterium sp. HNIBRBA15423]|uniref:hypothetical protein n=1 Tax=Flavobacterium sp. HNIBRBA15423 TaxID=3458683 RepID=UPI004043A062